MTHSREQNKIMETKAKTMQMYELPNNNLIITVIKMFSNLKRLQIKKKTVARKAVHEPNEKTKKKKKKIEIQKEPNRNSGVEKINNSQKDFNSRLFQTEERMIMLEHKLFEVIKPEEEKKIELRNMNKI